MLRLKQLNVDSVADSLSTVDAQPVLSADAQSACLEMHKILESDQLVVRKAALTPLSHLRL